MEEKKISVTTLIAIGGLIIAIISLIVSYNVSRDNIAIQKDIYNKDNAPDIKITEVYFYDKEKDTIMFLDLVHDKKEK